MRETSARRQGRGRDRRPRAVAHAGLLQQREGVRGALGGGYLHTNDIANMTSDGYLQITDRIKDVIKTGGEWISSLELEDIITKSPGVKEAAVIGVKDEKWGERPDRSRRARPPNRSGGDRGFRQVLRRDVCGTWRDFQICDPANRHVRRAPGAHQRRQDRQEIIAAALHARRMRAGVNRDERNWPGTLKDSIMAGLVLAIHAGRRIVSCNL